MLFSHIKHYLNSEGLKFLPVWYKDLKSLFLQKEGFVNIEVFTIRMMKAAFIFGPRLLI